MHGKMYLGPALDEIHGTNVYDLATDFLGCLDGEILNTVRGRGGREG
jgi:hypothetical protein